MINARINTLPVNLIIDTGASRTVFDIAALGNKLPLQYPGETEEIHSAGIMAGNIESQSAVAESFKIGKLELHDFPIILINLEEMNKLYLKVTGKQIHGLLGSDFLLERNAIIDYEKSVLRIKKPIPQIL